jgi:hypothetical protein
MIGKGIVDVVDDVDDDETVGVVMAAAYCRLRSSRNEEER